MMGRGGGRAVDSGADRVTRCFFFGCGSSTGLDLCFDRTGTGIVVRVVARGKSGTGLPHLGVSRTGVEGWPTREVGLRALTSTCGGVPPSVHRGAEVWFGIQDHMGRDASMRYHCRCFRQKQARGQCVKSS